MSPGGALMGDNDPMARRDDVQVPRWLRIAASWSWQLLLVAAALVVVGLAFTRLRIIVVPIVAALFATTILAPPAQWLRRHGWPPLFATWAVFLCAAGVAVGIVFGLIPLTHGEFTVLGHDVTRGLNRTKDWLTGGPLHVSRSQLDSFFNQLSHSISSNEAGLVRGALSGVTLVAEVAAGVVLTIVLTFFFVKDGEVIAAWMAGLARNEERSLELRSLGDDVWRSLTRYVQAVAFNGLVDAILLVIALVALGVPLVVPLALLTFVGAFLPLVGAVIAGLIAALVTLVAKGVVYALIIVGVTVAIHNIEGYLSGPLVFRKAVRLHPVAILVVLSLGTILGGVIGAFVAVPLTAVLVTVFGHLRRSATSDGGGEVRPFGGQGGLGPPSGGGGAPRPQGSPLASGEDARRLERFEERGRAAGSE